MWDWPLVRMGRRVLHIDQTTSTSDSFCGIAISGKGKVVSERVAQGRHIARRAEDKKKDNRKEDKRGIYGNVGMITSN